MKELLSKDAELRNPTAIKRYACAFETVPPCEGVVRNVMQNEMRVVPLCVEHYDYVQEYRGYPDVSSCLRKLFDPLTRRQAGVKELDEGE